MFTLLAEESGAGNFRAPFLLLALLDDGGIERGSPRAPGPESGWLQLNCVPGPVLGPELGW